MSIHNIHFSGEIRKTSVILVEKNLIWRNNVQSEIEMILISLHNLIRAFSVH